MTFRINTNQLNGKTTFLALSNASVNVAGNSSVSDIAIDPENLTGTIITKIAWGTDDNIQIMRGANVVIVLTQTGHIVFHDLAITVDQSADLSIVSNSAKAFVAIELRRFHELLKVAVGRGGRIGRLFSRTSPTKQWGRAAPLHYSYKTMAPRGAITLPFERRGVLPSHDNSPNRSEHPCASL